MTFIKLPKAITAEELLSTPLPPVKWIVPGLLPAGLALFAGPSKAGKSWLTLWLCLQVAQGKPVWGREIEPHTVLYAQLFKALFFHQFQQGIFDCILCIGDSAIFPSGTRFHHLLTPVYYLIKLYTLSRKVQFCLFCPATVRFLRFRLV